MKVTRNEPPKPFVPVVITLETQEEVNEMHAWANHGVVCPRSSPLYGLFEKLEPHVNENNAWSSLSRRINP